MKKYILSAILFICFTLLFIGCGDTFINQNPTDTSNSNETISKTESTNTDSNNNIKPNKNNTNNSSPKTSTDIKKEPIIKTKTVRLYFYDAVQDKTSYSDKSIQVKDGALVSSIITALKENDNPGIVKPSPNIKIRSAQLNKAKNVLKVDFGGTFVNTMNLGSGPEAMLLQSIVNSLGYNFGVDNVHITIDGKNYSSGHILKNDNEFFTVDYSKFEN